MRSWLPLHKPSLSTSAGYTIIAIVLCLFWRVSHLKFSWVLSWLELSCIFVIWLGLFLCLWFYRSQMGLWCIWILVDENLSIWQTLLQIVCLDFSPLLILLDYHIRGYTIYISLHFSYSLSVCSPWRERWQTPARPNWMIKPVQGDTEWRLDKRDHLDGQGWSGGGWQLPFLLSWDSCPWGQGTSQGFQIGGVSTAEGWRILGVGGGKDGKLSKRILKSTIWSLSKWLALHYVF